MTLDSGARCAVSADSDGATADGTVTITLDRKTVAVPRTPGETLLESARRAGLTPPYSCEQGNCGTCIATLTDGRVTMRNNEVLSDEEIAEGYVLTCQGVPDSASVTVNYDD